MLVYVDDMIITSNNPTLTYHIVFTLNIFCPGHLDSLVFKSNISMSAPFIYPRAWYDRDFLNKTNMFDSKPLLYPMNVGLKLSKDGFDPLTNSIMCRSVGGCSPNLTFALLSTMWANYG